MVNSTNDFDNTTNNAALLQSYTLDMLWLELRIDGDKIKPIFTGLVFDALNSCFTIAQQYNTNPSGGSHVAASAASKAEYIVTVLELRVHAITANCGEEEVLRFMPPNPFSWDSTLFIGIIRRRIKVC